MRIFEAAEPVQSNDKLLVASTFLQCSDLIICGVTVRDSYSLQDNVALQQLSGWYSTLLPGMSVTWQSQKAVGY